MRKVLAAGLELLVGLILVAIAYLDVRLLLQSRSLVALVLPLVAVTALALGAWRGRASSLGLWLLVALLNLPLLAVLLVAGGRSWTLLGLSALGVAFAALGTAAARRAAPGPTRSSGWSAPGARLAVVLLATAVVVLGVAGRPFARSLIVSSEAREPAVPFQLALVAGAPVTSEQLRGRVAVIDFWATWCVPCQHELPELERLYARLAADRRVAFYAVDVGATDSPGDSGDTPVRAADFFRRHGYRIPLAFDTGARASAALRAHGLPTLLVLDRAGRVRLRHVGYAGAEDLGDTLGATIDKLLAEGPG